MTVFSKSSRFETAEQSCLKFSLSSGLFEFLDSLIFVLHQRLYFGRDPGFCFGGMVTVFCCVQLVWNSGAKLLEVFIEFRIVRVSG